MTVCIKQTKGNICLSLRRWYHWIIHEIIQTTQSHPCVRTKRHLLLLVLQSLPPTAPDGLLYAQVQSPHGSVWHVVSSFSRKHMWLINCCQSTCPVSDIMCPAIPITLTDRVKRKWIKQVPKDGTQWDGWVLREESRWYCQKLRRNAGQAQTTGVQDIMKSIQHRAWKPEGEPKYVGSRNTISTLL